MPIQNEYKVLVTGFGPFLDIKDNPSAQVLPLLPSILHGNDKTYKILSVPAFRAVYSELITEMPKLLAEHRPDIVIHLGLAADRDYFAIEKGADRHGYHDIPDEKRKVVSRLENKKLFGTNPVRLDSDIGFGEALLKRWKHNFDLKNGKISLKNKTIIGVSNSGLRLSDNVGNYVCGLLYYVSLLWFAGRGEPGRALFLHVPPLKDDHKLETYRDVVVALMQAI